MDVPTQQTLSRLLSHLSAQPPPRTAYARAKQQRNVDYARTLLLTAEKQSSTIRVQSQRQAVQADLQRQRDAITGLSRKLQEAEEADVEEDSEEDEQGEEDSEGDNGVSYEPARKDTNSGLDTGQTPAMRAEVLAQEAEASQATQQQQALRSRKTAPLGAKDNHSAASTTARETLFAGRPTQTSTNASNLSHSETLLSHNRTEQENLTTSLLSLASALKSSSQSFSASLETEKEVLRRAEGGLDKSAQGMEAAERKMGALRRMSEGQGWWGRIKLYGMIAVLWIFCFLIVFAAPKLRL